MEAEVGLGGAVVMDSLTPKSQETGDPGLEMMLADTWAMTSWTGSWLETSSRRRTTWWWVCGGSTGAGYEVVVTTKEDFIYTRCSKLKGVKEVKVSTV